MTDSLFFGRKGEFMTKKFMAILTSAGILLNISMQNAFAEDETPQPALAAWSEPLEEVAPWLDLTPVKTTHANPQIIATGKNIAIVTLPDGNPYAVDNDFQILGRIALPPNTAWTALDENDRILSHDGKRLYVAQSWLEASAVEGFLPILDLENPRAIDAAQHVVAFADAQNLSIVDLNTGVIKTWLLSDFFNDEKMTSVTPEVIAAQNGKKSKKNTKKSKSNESSNIQVADIQGIWWRHDGIGIVRVRSLMNVRTYLTTDQGTSWRQLDNAPKEIAHDHGWIWDGHDRVLSRDGQNWVRVCGPLESVANRWSLTHFREKSTTSSPWIELETPTTPTDDAPTEGEAACVSVSMIPDASRTGDASLFIQSDALYAPERENSGFAMGLYRNATNDADPTAWIFNENGVLSPLELPDACHPQFVAANHGLGIALCDASGGDLTVYAKTRNSEWTAEALVPQTIADKTSMMWADDGSLVLVGGCHTEKIEVPVMTDGDNLANGIESIPTETRYVYACTVAERMPQAIGMSDIWRIERIENASAFVPVNGGRLLSIEGRSENQRTIAMRTPLKTETIVENFDPSPYTGIVMTKEGCFALYDGTIPADELKNAVTPTISEDDEDEKKTPQPALKLLSTTGKLAQVDCATSRAVVESGMSQSEYVEVKKGDDRYGIRAGAGGFFAKNVQSWAMRIEVLIPVFKGGWELSFMYRMAGGNTSSALGHIGMVSMHWRYDELENFDFAAGAGIGFGTMCGYDKSADKNANDDDDSTSPSAYKDCNGKSLRYEIFGLASYKFSDRWKLFISASIIAGTTAAADVTGGLEVRF